MPFSKEVLTWPVSKMKAGLFQDHLVLAFHSWGLKKAGALPCLSSRETRPFQRQRRGQATCRTWAVPQPDGGARDRCTSSLELWYWQWLQPFGQKRRGWVPRFPAVSAAPTVLTVTDGEQKPPLTGGQGNRSFCCKQKFKFPASSPSTCQEGEGVRRACRR